ncbi:MAG: hypothetical protein ACK50Y_03240 [Flavobacteriia bacterium]|jgi:hypothetical protein
MKEGLLGPTVENVGFAVVEETVENEKIYNVYLLNMRQDIMEGIIVTSTGYGENVSTGERVRTSTLRHCLEVLLPGEVAKIEPIMEDVFGLANEYWISFWVEDVMYDKKFVFLPETVSSAKMKIIPQLGHKGVMLI